MENKCETSFKVGDKVKLVASAYPDGSALCATQGASFTIKEAIENGARRHAGWDNDSGIYSIDRCWVTGSMLELIPPTPKSLLSNFIRAVTRDGSMYIVVGSMLVDQNNVYILRDNLNDNLESEYKESTVDSLYWCEEDSLLIDFDYLGNLLWLRETPEDVAKKNKRFDLIASMKTLQTELDIMKKALEEME